MKSDGVSLTTAFGAAPIAARPIYAESFAPLFDFGWAGLRAVRNGAWKYISAPKPELYDISADPQSRPTVSMRSPLARLTPSAR